MDEAIAINIFQFAEFTADSIRACGHGPAPGVVVLALADSPMRWAYVSKADDTILSRLEALHANPPSELAEAVKGGRVRFGVAVLRRPDMRSAAEAFLVEQLCPFAQKERSPVPAEFTYNLKFYGDESLRPVYDPPSKSAKASAA